MFFLNNCPLHSHKARLATARQIFAALLGGQVAAEAVLLHEQVNHEVQLFVVAVADDGDFVGAGEDVGVVAEDAALVYEEGVYGRYRPLIFRHPTRNVYAGNAAPGVQVKEADLVGCVLPRKGLVGRRNIDEYLAALARLQQMGVKMSIRRIAKVAYHFAERARGRQAVDGMGIEGSLAGKRVVISTDGGRLRVRKNKRGKKTKKGRSHYSTDWREPKLLVIYVVDEKGRIAQEFAPVIDGTLQGPDEVFRLLEFYLRELKVREAKEVLFIADGAKWIWERVTRLWQRLGVVGVVRCRELVDFYHVVEHVYALAALNRSWGAPKRKQWATRQRHRLWRGELDKFLEDVERLCRGKRGKDWTREREYLLRNARAGRLNYSKARWAKMPMGSGSMESAVRRVVNLRLKGPGIFWHEEHAEQMLLLRAYYKSKHWQVLTNKAFATPLTNAA